MSPVQMVPTKISCYIADKLHLTMLVMNNCHKYYVLYLSINSISMVRERERERIHERSLGQQHINHSALATWVTKQSATFSHLFDDPNLPPSPLVPADSNKAKKKAVFFRFSFCPSALFYCSEEDGDGDGDGGVPFTATSSILMFSPAQQVWQHYSEHISTW